MEIMDIIKARHSVRQYETKPIEVEKRAILDEIADECNRESGLNIQIIYDESKCFGALFSKVARFKGCENYIAIVGSESDARLEEKAGYYGEKIVLKAQELGLNTCWVGLTHGKSQAVVNKGEKMVIMIALGYGANQGVQHKGKSVADVASMPEDAPEWYKTGVEAALLAPTAVNQQKFHIDLKGDNAMITADKGAYAVVDLGIVKYHFEVASGHSCVR